MTILTSDTLQKQISRGEVFHVQNNITSNSFTSGAARGFLITTGASNCSMNLEVVAPVTLQVLVVENPTTATGGGSLTAYNLNRESSNTLTTTVEVLSSYSGGTSIYSTKVERGYANERAVLSGEAGVILKPNEEYVVTVQNDSLQASTLNIGALLREDS